MQRAVTREGERGGGGVKAEGTESDLEQRCELEGVVDGEIGEMGEILVSGIAEEAGLRTC